MSDNTKFEELVFYFAVWDITRDVHDYAQLRKNPDSPYTKTKRQINKIIKCHLETFEITSANKITNLNKLCTIAHLIHDFPCKDNNGVRIKKDKLYSVIYAR